MRIKASALIGDAGLMDMSASVAGRQGTQLTQPFSSAVSCSDWSAFRSMAWMAS